MLRLVQTHRKVCCCYKSTKLYLWANNHKPSVKYMVVMFAHGRHYLGPVFLTIQPVDTVAWFDVKVLTVDINFNILIIGQSCLTRRTFSEQGDWYNQPYNSGKCSIKILFDSYPLSYVWLIVRAQKSIFTKLLQNSSNFFLSFSCPNPY